MKYGAADSYPTLHELFADAAAQDAVEHRIPAAVHTNINDRKGGWIQTFTGHKFWPLDPRPEDVRILDIAHALSMKCRFSGHCKFFYSVAEHSVLLARYLNSLEALLHDGAEAYSPLGDVPSPLKPDLPWLKAIECPIEVAVADSFRLEYPWSKAVKEADHRIIADEKLVLMQGVHEWTGYDQPLGVTIEGWHPGLAEALFLREFARLARHDR